MIVVIKNSDTSYYYLYKLLANSSNVLYKEEYFNDLDIDYLVISGVDSSGYIVDTNINLFNIIKSNKVKNLICENKISLLNINKISKLTNLIKLYDTENYLTKVNKIKSIILLKYILDDTKSSIFDLKFLILGQNNLSLIIYKELSNYSNNIALINKVNDDLYLESLDLGKYDIIINTTKDYILKDYMFIKINPNTIFYDMVKDITPLNLDLVTHNKYKIINNISLYYPIAKAHILYEMVIKYGGI